MGVKTEMTEVTEVKKLKPKDFASDQDVRWCPGCGNYAILAEIKRVLAEMRSKKENTVFVAGIGCSSRFPYYVDTYGMHTIHGRAPAIATGLKIANPELDVWIVTGDGDGLSIGGNHMMHVLRRNVNVNILLFNNQIYGLTKGQYSPTSIEGSKTKSSPMGSIDLPIGPTSMAIASEASFVARALDVDESLGEVIRCAAKHKGASFVEIYQDCAIFNHFAYRYVTDKETREDNILRLEHGKPMVFGKERGKGIWLDRNGKLKVVELGHGVGEDDMMVHDEHDESKAFMLSRMRYPEFPEPLGVLYRIEDDCYEDLLDEQISDAIAERGGGDLRALFEAGGTYSID